MRNYLERFRKFKYDNWGLYMLICVVSPLLGLPIAVAVYYLTFGSIEMYMGTVIAIPTLTYFGSYV